MTDVHATPKHCNYQPASNRLSAGSFVVLLPNRALELLGLAKAAGNWEDSPAVSPDLRDSATPGLRGLLSALGVTRSPATLRAQALSTEAQAAPSGHYYVAVELCHWQVEMGGARWMAHGERLNLATAERAEISTALADLFVTPDAQLIVHSNGELSLLCCAATPAVQAAFPDEALGCDLKTMLPTPKVWQRYLNEAQMRLADLPVNRTRVARGEVSVNSVWFWGPQPVKTEFKPLAFNYQGCDLILQVLSEPATTETIQIYDYRALFNVDLAQAVEQLPPAAKLWLNDGRVFQQRLRGGAVRRLWYQMVAKMRGIWS